MPEKNPDPKKLNPEELEDVAAGGIANQQGYPQPAPEEGNVPTQDPTYDSDRQPTQPDPHKFPT